MGRHIEGEMHSLRKTRSSSNKNTSLAEQFEQLCSSVGSQPWTCYYPDNRNVPIFELSTDIFTEKASGVNGSGPASCQQLKDSGHDLSGFYLVRFNSKRAKAVFCEFSNATKVTNKNKEETIEKTSENKANDRKTSKSIRFCGGVRGNQCTYLYSDHPDARPNGKNGKEPASCEDLYLIGHSLKGFYVVQFNTVKVRIIYCDFLGNTTDKTTNKINYVESSSNWNKSESMLYCNGLGSQPCSCYYSNSPNILQFELGNDEITRQALSGKSAGPASCKDLETIGYTFDGFYIVRFRVKAMKTVFCRFNRTSAKLENNNKTSSTLKPSKTLSTLRSRNSGITFYLLHFYNYTILVLI